MGVKPTIERSSLGLDVSELPNDLSLALGSAVLALQMATHYAIFANGGYQVAPWLIEQSRTSKAKLSYEFDALFDCPRSPGGPHPSGKTRKRARGSPNLGSFGRALGASGTGSRVEFHHDSMLRDVVQRHPHRAKAERADIAEKTGATNEQVDAWFNGYHTSVAASAWVGLDTPETLAAENTVALQPCRFGSISCESP